ncbi:MAG: class I SAM-dependent methyltransferase [Candidatus Odyssella sp.]|nr:class I SAM-dependent methyltransferase [Candidatus Odyssella sp.]
MKRLIKPLCAAAAALRAAFRPPTAGLAATQAASSSPAPVPVDDPYDIERLVGGEHYRSFLKRVHETLAPRVYLEIGVFEGASLSIAACRAIAVDPDPKLASQGPLVEVHTKTSDAFFAEDAATALRTRHDLAFIDGLHLFEFVLRDFMNTERFANPWAAVVVDDIFPNHPAQASRNRHTLTWMGDVWKLADCLARYRPDLLVVQLDTWPSGLLFVAGLDPENTVLRDRYDEILARYLGPDYDVVPASVVARRDGVDPTSAWLQRVFDYLGKARGLNLTAAEIGRSVRSLRG